MSCDAHHRTCPRYLPEEYSNQISKIFKKYLSSYRADKLGHKDGQRRTGGRRQRQYPFGLSTEGYQYHNKTQQM